MPRLPIEDEQSLIIRYANNYGLQASSINIEMVMKHWNLERELTKKLLASNKHSRRQQFIEAYNTLYYELPWLAKTGSDELNFLNLYQERWQHLLGNIKGKKIFEVGSGNGNLINYLADHGGYCVGTEIAESRSSKVSKPYLEWHITDGVNLAFYEPLNAFDLVISDQVVEHLHPDDINTHFENAFKLLKPDGKYVFYTPSYFIGPGDVSRIFGCIEAEGMHLKEYKYYEMYHILKSAGFKNISIPLSTYNKSAMLSSFNVKLFLSIEKSLAHLPGLILKKKVYHRLIKLFNIPAEIVIVAEKC